MLLLGNLLSFIGCLIMVATGLIKKKERVLLVQCIQFTLMGAGHFCLGSGSGVVANIVSILRNIIFVKVKCTTWLKAAFIVLQLVLTLCAGIDTPISLLPLIAVVAYTWLLDLCGPIGFKVLNIGCQVLWVIHDFYYLNFASVIFDVLSIVSCIGGIILIRKARAKT